MAALDLGSRDMGRRHIAMARQAARDLRSLTHAQGLDRVEWALVEGLAADPPPGNLDIKALHGRGSWLRMRVGDWRIIYRPLTREELERWREDKVQTEGYLIARIVNRRDLDRALRTLEP